MAGGNQWAMSALGSGEATGASARSAIQGCAITALHIPTKLRG